MNYTGVVLSELGRFLFPSDPEKTPATALTVRGRDRPGRGDMSKRTRELDPLDVDRYLTVRIWCIWPNCNEIKIADTMLCHYHVAECAEMVYNLRAMPAATVDAREVERKAFTNKLLAPSETPKPPPPPDTRGHVYIIRMDDLIKIGYTTQPYQRLRAYPPNADLLVVFPGTKKDEAELHGRFRFALRKGREWFRVADEILEYVEEMRDRYGPPSKGLTDRFQEPGPRQPVGTKRWSGIKKTAA